MDMDTGLETPYSQAPADDLRIVASGDPCGGPNPNELEFWDGDFRRRYASYILSQRASP